MSVPQLLPEDIKPHWLSVIRRLQCVSRQDNQGLAILTIHVLVDAEGNPKLWSEPNVTKIEPKRAAGEILALLASQFKQD